MSALNRARALCPGLLLALFLARPAAGAAPALRAVDRGSLAMSANGQLEERLTLNRDLASALLAVPLEGSLRIVDWPLFPGVRGAVTLARHDVYAPGARVVKIVPEGELEIPHSRLAFFWGEDESSGDRVVVSVDPADGSLDGRTFSEDGVRELRRLPVEPVGRYRLAAPEPLKAASDGRPWSCGAEALPPAPPEAPVTVRLTTGDEVVPESLVQQLIHEQPLAPPQAVQNMALVEV